MGIGTHGSQHDFFCPGGGAVRLHMNIFFGDSDAGRINSERSISGDISFDSIHIPVCLYKAFQIPTAGTGTIHHAALAALDDKVDELEIGPLHPERRGQIPGRQTVRFQVEYSFQHGHGFIQNLCFTRRDLTVLNIHRIRIGKYILRSPDGSAHGIARRNAYRFRCLRTVEVCAAQLGVDGHAGKVSRLRNQVSRRILECFRHYNQTVTPQGFPEGTHQSQIRKDVDTGNVHLDGGQLARKARMDGKSLRQQTHGQRHAVGTAYIVEMFMGIELHINIVLCADLKGFITIDDLGFIVMNAAAAKVDVNDGSDVCAVKTGNQRV